MWFCISSQAKYTDTVVPNLAQGPGFDTSSFASQLNIWASHSMCAIPAPVTDIKHVNKNTKVKLLILEQQNLLMFMSLSVNEPSDFIFVLFFYWQPPLQYWEPPPGGYGNETFNVNKWTRGSSQGIRGKLKFYLKKLETHQFFKVLKTGLCFDYILVLTSSR